MEEKDLYEELRRRHPFATEIVGFIIVVLLVFFPALVTVALALKFPVFGGALVIAGLAMVIVIPFWIVVAAAIKINRGG